jgi:hypothetical protein
MIDVLILAAGSIKHKFSFIKFGFSSPALLPINTRTVSSYIIDFYLQREDLRVNLVINEKDFSNVLEELIYYKDKINFILVKETISVIETLDIALDKIDSDSDDVIVNIVTTIPVDFIPKDCFFISDEILEAKDYSVVFDGKFYYKGSEIHRGYAFTGVFRTKKDLIKRAISKVGYKNDLMYVVEALSDKLKPIHTKWIDVGHEINYNRARNLLISSRSFNSIQIIEGKSLLIKRSKSKKIKDEADFVSLLPSDMQIYFPRILKSSENQIIMEYYGYPTLAEYMLYWDLDELYWNQIFKSIERLLDEFYEYRCSIGFEDHIAFYYNKTIKRIEEFKEQMKKINLDFIFDDYITINEKKFKNLESLDKEIKCKIRDLYNKNDFCIMHGDLCFNNILYDIYSHIIRVIDARGSFGELKGIYGDRKYDVAKLTHSVIGQYDYIVNNIFKVKIEDNKIFYWIPRRKNYEYLKNLNLKLIEKYNYSYDDIIFLVGLIFVSMTPLHNDNIDRQIVMYAHGIKYINEGLK